MPEWASHRGHEGLGVVDLDEGSCGEVKEVSALAVVSEGTDSFGLLGAGVGEDMTLVKNGEIRSSDTMPFDGGDVVERIVDFAKEFDATGGVKCGVVVYDNAAVVDKVF